MSVVYNTIQILARQSTCRNKCKISVNILDNTGTMARMGSLYPQVPCNPNLVRSWQIYFVVPNLKSASPNTLKTILKSSKSVHYRQRYAHFSVFGVPVWKGHPGGGPGAIKFVPQHFPITMITTILEKTEKSISARKSYGNTCHTTLWARCNERDERRAGLYHRQDSDRRVVSRLHTRG